MQWSARTAETVTLGLAGALLALGALTLDAAGRVLVGAAGALLLAVALRDVVLRPRLTADGAGVVVRTLGGRDRLPWAGLRVRLRTTRRLGVRSRLLELDTAAGPDDAGTLVLLGRRDLGADPAAVARALEALRPG
ncbi:PH (Pleckstrin Homology) domain-containing protein [Geodermatophilus normandii]|uniref:PH (Pleckstrin Homology) domain-containing protein n=1 Tax=Geodermatophilus normandii TaxID=1137989 RepID=A0A317QIU0_9ACTN|nr:PH domain-containing protein [Geodermatophilus normandii]PWW22165.1 PH (Pleckstrin Homology) domain-containing protein [Geodermatophilus normandii]